jgi:hypothetical protein
MKNLINVVRVLGVITFSILLTSSSYSQKQETDYAGTYNTEWGKMILIVTGNSIAGNYEHDNGRIEGTFSGNVAEGKWFEESTNQPPTDAGIFRFEFSEDGSTFQGFWKYGFESGAWSGDWIGTKVPVTSVNISGIYETEWGELTLSQTENKVTGKYSYDEGRLEGTLTANVLAGKWFETPSFEPPDDAGLFEFVFTADFRSFTGSWKYGFEDGPLNSGSWSGARK